MVADSSPRLCPCGCEREVIGPVSKRWYSTACAKRFKYATDETYRQAHLAQTKAWKEANPEKRRAQRENYAPVAAARRRERFRTDEAFRAKVRLDQRTISRAYYARNKDKVAEANRARARRWHAENRTRALDRLRRWYEENRERAIENARRWKEANPEKSQAYASKWARKRHRRRVGRRYGRQGGRPQGSTKYDWTQIDVYRAQGISWGKIAIKLGTTAGSLKANANYRRRQIKTETG